MGHYLSEMDDEVQDYYANLGKSLTASAPLPQDNFQAIMQKLPAFNDGWSEPVKREWFRAYSALLRQGMLPEDDSDPD